MARSDSTAPKLSRGKRFGFAVLITTAFFLALEGLLAAFDVQPAIRRHDPFVGFQSHIPLMVPERVGDHTVLRTAKNKLAFFNPQQFTKVKPPNTVRIFCLGGSTTFGRPYDDATSFPGWLRELLPSADGSVRWEVINVGGISYASYRITKLMEELVEYSPDLFIVYTGHNEFLEERTYHDSSTRQAYWHLPAVALMHSRTFSIAHRWVGESFPTGTERSLLPAEVDAILDHSVGPDAYQRDVQQQTAVVEHFRFNIDRMIDLARAAEAQIIFVKPTSNQKDFSPFKSQHRDGMSDAQSEQWQSLYAEGIQLAGEQFYGRAIEKLTQAALIDDQHAELNFRIGQCLFATGQYDQARGFFQRAIDFDVCPLRATSSIQQAVESVAVSRRAPLIDLDSILTEDCLRTFGHPCLGTDYFLDHVHPTVGVNRMLALALIQALEQGGVIRPSEQWSDATITEVSERVLSKIDPDKQSRALTNVAQVLSWAGKQREAGPIAQTALELRRTHGLKPDAESLFYSAIGYAIEGNVDRAIELLRRVVSVQSDDGQIPKDLSVQSQAHVKLGQLLYDQQQYDDAIEHLSRAAELDPTDTATAALLKSAKQSRDTSDSVQ